jgi:hypothetical protein
MDDARRGPSVISGMINSSAHTGGPNGSVMRLELGKKSSALR